jgi:hypothetical protein
MRNYLFIEEVYPEFIEPKYQLLLLIYELRLNSFCI